MRYQLYWVPTPASPGSFLVWTIRWLSLCGHPGGPCRRKAVWTCGTPQRYQHTCYSTLVSTWLDLWLYLWPLQTVSCSQDPLRVNQSSSTEMNSCAVRRTNTVWWDITLLRSDGIKMHFKSLLQSKSVFVSQGLVYNLKDLTLTRIIL